MKKEGIEEEFDQWIENFYEIYKKNIISTINRYKKVSIIVPGTPAKMVVDDEYISTRTKLSEAIERLSNTKEMTEVEHDNILTEIREYHKILAEKIYNNEIIEE